MLYRGVVSRVKGNKLYVIVPVLSDTTPFGPMNVIAGDYSAQVDLTLEDMFAKGDSVIVGDIGYDKDELFVLGKVITGG